MKNVWIAFFLLISPATHATLYEMSVDQDVQFSSLPNLEDGSYFSFTFLYDSEAMKLYNWRAYAKGDFLGSQAAASAIYYSVYDDGWYARTDPVMLDNGWTLNFWQLNVSSVDGMGFSESLVSGGWWLSYLDVFDDDEFLFTSASPEIKIFEVPEPATLSLLALGLAAIGIRRRYS